MRGRRRTLTGAGLAGLVTLATLVLGVAPAAAAPPANAYGPVGYTCIDNWDGRAECFWVGTSTQWGGWASLGGALASGPYLSYRTGGAIRVDVIGVDGAWHYKYQVRPSCCWTTNWL